MSFARLASVAALALVPAHAFGDEAHPASDVSYQLETSVASDYVARAMPQYAGQAASSQNTATIKIDHVGPGALSFSAWNAVALSDYSAQPGDALEIDLTAGYAVTRGKLALTAGYTAYLFPSHAAGAPLDGAHEIFGSVSYNNPYVVPTAAAWIECVRQQGAYVSLAGSHDFHAGHWTLSPGVSIGAAGYRKYLGAQVVAYPHLNDVSATFGARLDLPEGGYAALRGSYAYRGTPEDLMPADGGMDFSDRSTLVGLVAVGVTR